MSPSNSLIIASLGSSFAAGPVLPKDRNYPSLVAERRGARLVDVSSTGATLDNITRTSQKVDENLLPPQISKVPSNADVVTLTAGGNDIEYSRSMIIDSIKVSKPGFKGPDLNKRLSFSQLKNRFEETLREIHTAAAGAQIYLVQYLSVFGSATISGRDTPLSAESIAHFQEQGQLIDRAMSEAAASFPYARVVEIAKVSRGSALGTTTDPVVSGFLTKEQCKDGAMPYHPTEAGMEMVAEVVARSCTSALTRQRITSCLCTLERPLQTRFPP